MSSWIAELIAAYSPPIPAPVMNRNATNDQKSHAKPVSTVATHTPDACWPGAGWIAQPLEQTTVRLPLGNREINTAEYRIFRNQRMPQHVWFWHSYNRHVIREFNPRRPIELLGSVLKFGIRSQGEQMFIRLSSNQPWPAIEHEPLVHEILGKLEPYGL